MISNIIEKKMRKRKTINQTLKILRNKKKTKVTFRRYLEEI